MLIRIQGYNSGAQEYLEEGNKAGREYTRDELDERVMLYGDLDLTRMVYESIPDNGQDRYLSITMAFREDIVTADTLHNVTTELRQFLMYAYKEDEFNFYAEAHLPKIKQIRDKKTGDLIERKPHIHIIVPRKNMLSGNEANPVGIYQSNERYFEAFQEYLNQKYNLASPREHVRIGPKDAASVLSRYKGDDFYGKNREFKQDLVKQVIAENVTTRADFYTLVASHGETRIRNEGKPSEYIAVKLPDDAKFTNLKDTIFHDDFIVRRELKKPPLDKSIIQERLQAWPQRAKEIKYVSKATPSFRQLYRSSSVAEKAQHLIEREQAFYQQYGNPYDRPLHTAERQRDHQRSADETGTERAAKFTGGLQDLSVSDVADHRPAGSPGSGDSTLLLPADAHLHLGQSEQGGNPGLRSPVSAGGRGRGSTSGRRHSAFSAQTTGTSVAADGLSRSAIRRHGVRGHRAGDVIPPYARNPYRVATVADIEARSQRLFDPLKVPVDSALTITLASPRNPGSVGTLDPPDPAPAGERPQTRHRKPRSTPAGPRNIPPYARNPHRVSTIDDIERRSQRLFAPLKTSVDSPLLIKLMSPKTVTPNRNASTVSAYLYRQFEQNQLLPEQRKAVQRINKQFYETRRALFSDDRLSRQDKTQLVSVLTFERLKAREAIQQPLLHKESTYMGSAEIRALIDKDQEKESPQFSISGPGPSHTPPVRERVKRIISNLTLQVDEKASKERERELSAKDIYTRRSRFSQNVHYLDKATDKTLFVDAGKSIAMRRNGITEAGVAVALQLATQRFGSTLTINGNAEFKRLVVEAAAKGNMDIHFTDKHMNQALMARRAELAIERDGQQIQAPDVAQPDVSEVTPEQEQPSTASAAKAAPATEDKTLIVGALLDHGAAPYKHDEKNQASYFVSVQTESGTRTVWSAGLQEVMQAQGCVQGDQIKLKDGGKEPLTRQERQPDGSIKEIPGFRRTWSVESQTATRETLPATESNAPTASAERVQNMPVAPITIVHNGESVTVDPANTSDVATYTRQLNTEVSVQRESIEHATQRIGELENMRDNLTTGRGPDFVEQCNAEIGKAQRNIQGSQTLIDQAQTSLLKLGALAVVAERSVTSVELPDMELEPIAPMQVEPEEDHEPEMD